MRRLITISAVSLSILSPEVLLTQVAMGNIGFRAVLDPIPILPLWAMAFMGFCWRLLAHCLRRQKFWLKAMCFDIGNVSLGGGDYRPASELGRSSGTQLRMP